MPEAVVYKADDRSILLPYYKRFAVDPLLPFIPARVHPNTITHWGHALNLFGMLLLLTLWPKRGFIPVLVAALLQIYMWCDNADGSHARRTNQCSAFGEFLDHGLDILNVIYIGYMSAFALGATPMQWIAISILVPLAGAATYWEQSQTGIFRLGMLNQVESCTLLSVVLVAVGFLGTDFAANTKFFGFLSIRAFFVVWLTLSISFGAIRGIFRVIGVGASAWPMIALVSFLGSIALAGWMGAISALAAVALATAVNIFFCTRMLAVRMHGDRPQVDWVLVVGAIAMLGFIGWRRLGLPVTQNTGIALVALACVVLGGQALLNTRVGLQRLERIEG